MSQESGRSQVKVRVVSVAKPCNAGHRVGDEVIFKHNQVVGRLCFDSLCSMMAKVHSLRYGASFPWLKDPDQPARHGCPDGANVTFELSRLPSGK